MTPPLRVLVTGPNGFVGSRLVPLLRSQGMEVVPAGRPETGGIGPETDWSVLLKGVDAVVHLAARAHVMDERSQNPLAEYRRVNVEGTRRLAREAARLGVRRFILMSSVKVLGEGTIPGSPYMDSTTPDPQDPYGVSKREAEQALFEEANGTSLEPCVIRPPLVYGPGVRANFLKLLEGVDRRLPLPLGGVRNARSLVFVGNLADAVLQALVKPGSPGRIFLVSDGRPISSPDLVRALGAALGKRPRLLPVPEWALRWAGMLTGKSAAVKRLLGSLVVDDSGIRRHLGWQPPFTLEQGLKETVEWHRLRG